ncbi:MAG: UDP-3-O-(3-hydroxymyristoyl)glucosamine N-acyltransferase [Armatimonadota bacterium]
MQISSADIAILVGGILDGKPDAIITGAAGVDDAETGDVVLAEDVKYFAKAVSSEASCIIAHSDSGPAAGKCLIRVADPVEAFIKVLETFKGGEAGPDLGIGYGAVIEQGALLGQDVAVGANCFVGRGASLGAGCVLYPGVYVGRDVAIGEGCVLYPGVVVYPKCKLGKHVILHAGVVIGADGFGYKPSPQGLMKFPHIGTVEIGDDVEIGANSTVDRAKTGATVIGSGTKIDNLVHVAHNVKVGSHCIIVAQSGVAGSVEIGSGVVVAAQVGIKDHVRIADGVTVAARAGVIGDIEKGAVVSGFPAREHRAEMRAQAARLRLPEILARLRDLEKEVARLGGE